MLSMKFHLNWPTDYWGEEVDARQTKGDHNNSPWAKLRWAKKWTDDGHGHCLITIGHPKLSAQMRWNIKNKLVTKKVNNRFSGIYDYNRTTRGPWWAWICSPGLTELQWFSKMNLYTYKQRDAMPDGGYIYQRIRINWTILVSKGTFVPNHYQIWPTLLVKKII